MAPPSNITRVTAANIPALPFSIAQDLNDSGTTYDVWYKYAPVADSTVTIYADGLPFAQIQVDVFQDAETSLWMDMGDLWAPKNLPIYIPLVGGHTYYLNCYALDGAASFVANTVLNLSVDETPTDAIVAGDFLVNYEVDLDSEYPAAARSGSADFMMKRYVQVVPPQATRGQTGLPHGQTGQMFQSGVAVWADEAYDNVKFYNANTLALVSTLALAQPTMGMRRATDTLYTLEVVAGVSTVRQYNDAGTIQSTLVTSTPITIAGFIGVNSAGTILYYVQIGTTRIRRWDLANNVVLSDLVADTAGYRCEDLLVLEDDTILMLFFAESGTPKDVYVLQFNPAGATLHTYAFGAFWRDSFNPPRMGYALDSPDSFWIRLQPEANYSLSLWKHIAIATGSTLTTRQHVNYLGGTSLSGITQGFANTQNTTFTMLPVAGLTFDVTLQVTVIETFANGSGAQTTFQIGKTGDNDFFVPASTFTNQLEGANFVFPITLAAGENLTVTGTTKTGTGTGRILVGAFTDDTLGPLGAEKSGALLVVPTTLSPFPDFVNGPEALEAFEGAGLLKAFDVPRVRTAPHLADEGERLFYSKFQLDIEAGAGTVTGQGVDPVLLLRYSNDGGFTWSAWRQLSVGALGQYRWRCIAWRLGMARDRVFQVRQTDPVKSAWLTAYLDFEDGSA